MRWYPPIILLVLIGCVVPEQALGPDKFPQILQQNPLPAIPAVFTTAPFKIELKLLIDKEGNVASAELVKPAIDRAWDSLALASIRQWKFSPAVYNGAPIRMWIRFPVVVTFGEPKTMELAEIVCLTSGIADSVYKLLQSGNEFADLARKFSVSESATQGGVLGRVDIQTYPTHVRKALLDLKERDFTVPLQMGNRFVIFKHLASIL